MASEIATRETGSGVVSNARNMASSSVAFLKGIATRSSPAGFEPSNDWDQAAGDVKMRRASMTPSVIARNAKITGSITTLDELHVYGAIEGDIRAASITVCAGGTVKGDLTAETVIIAGAVEGRIHGGDVVLRAGASVQGEIAHRTLGIATAAVFEGSIKRSSGAPAGTSATA